MLGWLLVLQLVHCGAIRIFPITSSSGVHWSVSNLNNATRILSPATVPGDVFTDLVASKHISDPFFSFGEEKLQWVARQNWTYFANFDVDSAVLSSPNVLLQFSGLMTVCDITCNGKAMGPANNQFRRWTFPVKGLLKEKSNNLSVSFRSIASPNPPTHHEPPPPIRIKYRQEQDSWGWDWGPNFVAQGIWLPVNVIGYDTRIVEVALYPFHNSSSPLLNGDNTWTMQADVFLEGTEGHTVEILVRGSWDGVDHTTTVQLKKAVAKYTLHIPAKDVRLWWPNGYGAQASYAVTVYIKQTKANGGTTLDETIKMTSFRTVEMYNKVGTKGDSYQYFKINGKPIFVMGANWIPADNFESRVTKAVLSDLLTSVQAVNMNILRVWGGGLYQKDEFYDLCDALGIMIWQEFIFSDSTYPVDEPFLANVKQEVAEQVRRLSRHPSIITWSGNNEINPLPWYKGHTQDWYTLYIDTVFDTVVQEDRSRVIRPTCPSDGFATGTYDNGLPNGKPLTLVSQSDPGPGGERHYYNFTTCKTLEQCGVCTNIAEYPYTDFASEFGWMSAASFETMKPYLSGEDEYNLLSDGMKERENWLFHNQQLYNQVLYNFPNAAPSNPNATNEATFRRMIYLTQLVQSQCIRQEVEFYRRGRDTDRHTMASMYWMLNDIWPAPTWSSIEYGGRWKVLHHMAKEFYQAVHPSLWLFHDGNNKNQLTVGVHVTNDRLEAYSGDIHLYVVPYSSPKRTLWLKKHITIPALSGLFITNTTVASILSQGGCTGASDCFVYVELAHPAHGNNITTQLWLSELKEAKLEASTTTITVQSRIGREVILSLDTQVLNIYTTLTTTIKGTFFTNAFLMFPGEYIVSFKGKEDFTSQQLLDSIEIQCYNQCTHQH